MFLNVILRKRYCKIWEIWKKKLSFAPPYHQHVFGKNVFREKKKRKLKLKGIKIFCWRATYALSCHGKELLLLSSCCGFMHLRCTALWMTIMYCSFILPLFNKIKSFIIYLCMWACIINTYHNERNIYFVDVVVSSFESVF